MSVLVGLDSSVARRPGSQSLVSATPWYQDSVRSVLVIVPDGIANVVRAAGRPGKRRPTGEQDLQLLKQLPQGQADAAGLESGAVPEGGDRHQGHAVVSASKAAALEAVQPERYVT